MDGAKKGNIIGKIEEKEEVVLFGNINRRNGQ